MASTVGPDTMVPRLIEKAFVLNFHGEEIRIQQIDPEGVTVPQNHVGEDKLANFCFPESVEEIRRTLDAHQSQFYTFALTNIDNKQLFGFCFRFLIYGEHLPRCICLMSYLPWFSFFQTILLHLARMVTQHDNFSNIQRVVTKMMTFQFNKKDRVSFDIEENNKTIAFVRTPVQEEAPWGYPSLKSLLTSLSTININKLFSALLHERRIIMWSQDLQKLSECMFASISLLYPFLWTHIFIPLLPSTLLRYCCAPMPFFIGIHGSNIDEVKDMALEEVFFIDLDKNNCTTNYYDAEYDEEFLLYEENVLPENHLHLINNAIEDYLKMIKKAQSADEEVVRSGFRQFFLLLVGNYKKYMKPVNGQYEFEKDLFLSKQPKQASYFMNSFCNLQMFERFMAEREAHFAKHKGELFYPSASNPSQQLPKNFKDVPSKFNNELIFITFENQADTLSRKTEFDHSLTNLKTNIDAQLNVFNQGFKKNFGLFLNKMGELKNKIVPIADSIVLGDEHKKPKPTPQRAMGHRRNKSEIPVGSPAGSDDEDDDENKPVFKRAYSAKDLASLDNDEDDEDISALSQSDYIHGNTTGAVVNPPQYRRPSLSASLTPKKGKFQVNINPATEQKETQLSPEDKNSVVIPAPKPKNRVSFTGKSPTKVTFGSDDFSSYPAEVFNNDNVLSLKDSVPRSTSGFFEDISFTEFQSNAPSNNNNENQNETDASANGAPAIIILPNGLQASPTNPFIS